MQLESAGHAQPKHRCQFLGPSFPHQACPGVACLPRASTAIREISVRSFAFVFCPAHPTSMDRTKGAEPGYRRQLQSQTWCR